MNPIFRNEFRMILPAWVAGMIAATVPVWIFGINFFNNWNYRFSEDNAVFNFSLIVLGIAAVLVSVSSFGTELNCGTFASLLSQPRARWEIWQTKIIVLLAALVSMALANYLSGWGWISAVRSAQTITNDWRMSFVDHLWRSHEALLAPMMAMAFASGLCTTIWLRQTTSALWVALAVPFILCEISDALVSLKTGPYAQYEVVLALGLTALVYTPAAYFAGRWMFMRAEVKQSQLQAEPLSLSVLPSLPSRVSCWRALFIKEIRLQQGVIIIAVGVLVLHLFAIALPMYLPHSSYTIRNVSEAAWVIWLLLPILVGGIAIAEERRSGTLGEALCLPVQWKMAFAVKFIVVFGLGIFFGAVMPSLVEGVRPGGGNFLHGKDYPWELGTGVLVLTGMGFYASSLANSVLHALGCGVLAGFTILPFVAWVLVRDDLFIPTGLFACFMFMAYRNSKQTRATRTFYLFNMLQATSAVALAGVIGWCFSEF